MSEDGMERPANFPVYKHEFVQKCLDTDGVVTEIDEHRYGHEYHAGLEDGDGWVWMATIKTDNAEGLDADEATTKVTFRKALPGHELHVMYSWSTVAVKRLPGPSDLDSWRSIHSVFHAADELLRTHEDALSPSDTDRSDGGQR
jgi:hypothetical protein